MRFIGLFLALMMVLIGTPSRAADVGPGLFIRNGTSTISSPIAGQTYVLDYSKSPPQMLVWNGSSYAQMTPAQSNYVAVTTPTTSNDSTQGYGIGSLWFDTIGGNLYVCTSPTATAAVWVLSLSSSSASIATKLTTGDIMTDWVVSGLLGSVPGSSATMTTPSGVAVVSGSRISSAGGAHTYTVSKDTYDFLLTDGSIFHDVVPNGDPPPSHVGLAIQKVVTNGTVITAVTQLANTLPLISVANATTTTQALNEVVADARYAPYTGSTYVSVVAAGSLSPLFSCSVSNATSTPTLNFALTNAAAGTIFGNPSSGSGAPSYFTIGSNDQVLAMAHTGSALEGKTITAGTGIGVTPSAGAITINNTGVTSAAFTGDGVVYNSSVTGSPITTTGTFAPSLHTQSAGTVLGNFSGSTAAPTFGSVGTADQLLSRAHTGGGLEGKTLVAGANVTITPATNSITIAAAGGSAAPFAPGGTADLTTLYQAYPYASAVSADGLFGYVGGQLASSHTHGAITKINMLTGAIVGTLDMGASTEPGMFLLSADGTHLYAFDLAAVSNMSPTMWDVTTAFSLAVAHTSTLSPGPHRPSYLNNCSVDLSPDGTTIVFGSGADDNIYKIDTTTYAVTNFAAGHSVTGGGQNVRAVCFFSGSNSEIYVAYNGIDNVDLYTSGTYTSTLACTVGGSPAFDCMRSGGVGNGSLFISDHQGNLIVSSYGGAPAIYKFPKWNIFSMSVNSLSDTSIIDSVDICSIVNQDQSINHLVYTADFTGVRQMALPPGLDPNVGFEQAVSVSMGQNPATTIYAISSNLGIAGSIPRVWGLSSAFNQSQLLLTSTAAGASYVVGSNERVGSGTLSGGTLSVSNTSITANSHVILQPTGSLLGALTVTSTTPGTGFTAGGTGSQTFDYIIYEKQ